MSDLDPAANNGAAIGIDHVGIVGAVRVLPPEVASAIFPGTTGAPPLIGLTVATEGAGGAVVHAGGVAIRFAAVSG
jgi:hypothetical protein